MATLLARPRPTPLFVAGTSINQGQFSDRFDHDVLLSAPADVLLARVADRVDNSYGRTPADRQKILRDQAETEPLLRQRAALEPDVTQPLDVVVQALVALVQRA